MDNDRTDRWSRALATPEQLAPGGPPKSPSHEMFARVVGASASRRGVIRALLTTLFASRLPATRSVARQRETCPCPDPPCFLRKWSRDPSAARQFDGPSGAAVAPNGTVYVADTGTHRVQYFDRTGTFLGRWGRNGEEAGQFVLPGGAAVAPDGKTVYVVDAGNSRVQAFCVVPKAEEIDTAPPLPLARPSSPARRLRRCGPRASTGPWLWTRLSGDPDGGGGGFDGPLDRGTEWHPLWLRRVPRQVSRF